MNRRYEKYSMNNYVMQPSTVILPGTIYQPNYTTVIVPQQVGSAIVGMPVIVQNRHPITTCIVNPFTGRIEYAYI